MDFGKALLILKSGGKVKRAGWNGKDQYIFVDFHPKPDEEYEPCLCIRNQQGKIQPGWLASQADMLAEDWVMYVEARGKADG